MRRVSLVRRATFRASHRYWRHDWSPEENEASFGRQTEVHEHDYVLGVTVRGAPDPETGFIVELEALDRAIESELAPIRGADLSEAVPEFAQGGLMPSTENLALLFWDRLLPRMPEAVELARVRVEESPSLVAEYEGGEG